MDGYLGVSAGQPRITTQSGSFVARRFEIIGVAYSSGKPLHGTFQGIPTSNLETGTHVQDLLMLLQWQRPSHRMMFYNCRGHLGACSATPAYKPIFENMSA